MKRKKSGLFTPYLDTLGGGEKHVLSILKVLEGEGFDTTLFWDANLAGEIRKRFNLKFHSLTFAPNIFKKKGILEKIKTLRDFDHFFYVTDGSYFYSTADHTYIFCMVPDKNLYRMSLLNKLKLKKATFLANSAFTQKHLLKYGVSSQVIYPYVNDEFFEDLQVTKEPVILSVGRFFEHLHAKRHDVAISWFKKMKEQVPFLKNFKLFIAGGAKPEDEKYFEKLKRHAGRDTSIHFVKNPSFEELLKLYKKSLFFWHMTGIGVDEELQPHLVEHLGMTPLEAMAAGCITFCYKAGGPKEIIKNGHNGFLFESFSDLTKTMRDLLSSDTLQSEIQAQASDFVKKNFNYPVFRENVKRIILEQ